MSGQNEMQSLPLSELSRRDPSEPHRAATPLELLFDLVSVIAIAAAAVGLHHAIAENHIVDGVVRFACAFFGIWWAWMNYTWYASAYDNDDTVFRLLTMVIMSGALTMAAGIHAFLDSLNLTLVVIGYVMMRLAMIALWLRAAANDAKGRKTALSYAVGIAIAQVFWIALGANLPIEGGLFYVLFAVGVVLELTVPVLAERQSDTPWHRHHIIERYGLLNIIVLGETLLAASLAIGYTSAGHFDVQLLKIALAALVILFSMWWLYFANEDHLESQQLRRALIWGYGHVLVFAAGAAVGAGVAVSVDIATDHAKVAPIVGEFAVSIPVALYLFGLWFVRDRFVLSGSSKHALLVFALILGVAPIVGLGIELTAALTLASVVARNRMAQNRGA